MEIISRTSVKAIDKELYQKFLSNDTELAKQYAFDTAIHRYHKANINYDDISYDIQGDPLDYEKLETECRIDVLSPCPIDLRLDALLGRQLGLSREKIKALGKAGKIIRCDGKDIAKARLTGQLSLILYP